MPYLHICLGIIYMVTIKKYHNVYALISLDPQDFLIFPDSLLRNNLSFEEARWGQVLSELFVMRYASSSALFMSLCKCQWEDKDGYRGIPEYIHLSTKLR